MMSNEPTQLNYSDILRFPRLGVPLHAYTSKTLGRRKKVPGWGNILGPLTIRCMHCSDSL